MKKVFGYARVSTEDQNLNMQIDALKKYGATDIRQEKMTGTKKDRPELQKLLSELREGDVIVVYKLDRISRSTKHLIELSEQFQEMGVEFVSIRDSIDTSTANGRFFFKMLASIAELERDIISERTKAGLESARARGHNGGRPKASKSKIELGLKMYKEKQYTIKEIEEATGLSKMTLYRYFKKEGLR